MPGIYSDGAYLTKNPSWHAENSPWKARQIEAILRKNAVVPGTIAEVGCGAGEILVQLQKALPDADYSGFEISPQAFALCRERESARIHYHLKDLLEDNAAYFDVLLVIDVFEHVDDYLGFLKRVRDKARFKVFHIPLDLSLQALFRVSPILEQRESVGHLHYFFKDTALATLKYCGYEVIESFYTAVGFEGSNLSLRSKLLKLPRRLMFKLNADVAVRILGGYSLLVLAR
ncbi:MAG: class I SAM-dependent methyltransferase [Xanthobacteraceae bacterium]